MRSISVLKPGIRVLLCLLLGCLSPAGWAGDVRDVHLTAYVIDIDEVNSVKQSFTLNFYISASWRDPALAHGGPDSKSVPLDDIWYPHLQILNEQSLKPTFPRTAEVRPDGLVIMRQRFFGSLSQPLELRRFPFDSQQLKIIIVGLAWGSTPYQLVISPDSMMTETLLIPDWTIKGWNYQTSMLPIGPRDSGLPAAVFSVDIERQTAFFSLKVILPLLLIVAMSWLVLWLDPSLAAPRISVAVTTMLTLIAYRFAIGSMVPRLPFLTSLDYFVLASTVLVFLNLAAVIWSTRLHNRGQKEQAMSVDRKGLWLVPLLYALLVVETLHLHVFI